MGAGTHECPWPNCTIQVSRRMLACKAHWYKLPRELRDELRASYREGPHERHMEAIMDCVDWYSEQTPVR